MQLLGKISITPYPRPILVFVVVLVLAALGVLLVVAMASFKRKK